MKRKIIGIVAAVALASVGTVALVGYVQSAKDEAAAAGAPVEVYVLSKDVPALTPIQDIEKSLKVLSVPKDVQVEGAVRDLDALGDELVAAVDLRAGEQLLTSRLVDKGEAAKSDVPEGLQEVTVALDPERALGGDLKVGDTVGVLLSFDPFDTNVIRFDPANPFPVATPDTQSTPDAPAQGGQTDGTTSTGESAKTPNVTHLTFHKVLVTGVKFNQNDTDAAESGKATDDAETATDAVTVEQAPSGALLVTLALSSHDVEQVVFAAEFGHIWLTAENADADESGTRIVDLGEAYAATAVAP